MTQELSEIRQKIDAIDDHVHDLLMERASLVSSVAAAKRREGLQIVQPAREARMIRRLLKRHHGPLPQATIVRIWRELVGSVSLLQTGLTVTVAAQEGHSDLWDMAKNYFGSAVPMKKINGNSNAIHAVREDEASFAVMPWPEVESSGPWWAHLLDQAVEPIAIIAALPYGTENREETEIQQRGLVISKISFLSSNEDVSFVGLKLQTSVSRAKLQETFSKTGLEVLNIYSTSSGHDSLYSYMVEVNRFVGQSDPAIETVRIALAQICRYAGVIGGYPVIPELKRPEIGVIDV